jgi:DeoR/GlpR family transcriptional regulator of sugar metabolism
MKNVPCRHISEERKSRLLDLARRDPALRLHQLAKRLGMSTTTVRKILGPEESEKRRGHGGHQWPG